MKLDGGGSHEAIRKLGLQTSEHLPILSIFNASRVYKFLPPPSPNLKQKLLLHVT